MSKKKKPENAPRQQKNATGNRKAMINFAIGLAVSMIAYFALSSTAFFANVINLPIVKGYAQLGNAVLNLFGINTFVEGAHINGELFNMNIGRGCDAVAPTILFMAAILVYPTDFSNKWKWLLLAPFGFALLNLIRIVSLYLLGAYVPSAFDFAHIEFWQGVFIIITILIWFYWLLSVLKKNKTHESA